MVKLVHNIVPAVNRSRIEHPALLGLSPRFHPFVEQLIRIYRKLSLIQRLCQSCRALVYTAGRHGGIAQENSLKILLIRLLPVFFMNLGKWRFVCPCKRTLLVALMDFLYQLFLCEHTAAIRLNAHIQHPLQESSHLSVLLLFKRLGQQGLIPFRTRCITGRFRLFSPLCQHANRRFPLRSFLCLQQSLHICLPFFLPIKDVQQFFSHGLCSLTCKSQNRILVLFQVLTH